MAIASDRTVTDLDPLGRTIDNDALDALFAPASENGSGRSFQGSFHYDGCRVETTGGGTVRLLEEAE